MSYHKTAWLARDKAEDAAPQKVRNYIAKVRTRRRKGMAAAASAGTWWQPLKGWGLKGGRSRRQG